jgi:hypothetical protein
MKTILIACLCVMGAIVFAQAQPAPSSPAAPAASVAASASISPTPESKTERAIRDKLKKHFSFTIDDHDTNTDEGHEHHKGGADEIPEFVLPIVGIVFLSIFGAPVLIVAVILFFGSTRSRMQHKTIRMLVEKGQPVPAELLAPPTPAVRQRSDMRRGVVLSMIGLGVMVWLGAVNDWEGGAWSLGLIPFLIGAGYLIVWKLEGGKSSADKPPPLP